MRAGVRILVVLVLLAAVAPAVSSACPLCKEAKSDTDYPGGGASLPRGFYYSILLMVSAPFAVVGGLAVRIFLARRRTESKPSPVESPSPAARATLFPDSRGAQP